MKKILKILLLLPKGVEPTREILKNFLFFHLISFGFLVSLLALFKYLILRKPPEFILHLFEGVFIIIVYNLVFRLSFHRTLLPAMLKLKGELEKERERKREKEEEKEKLKFIKGLKEEGLKSLLSHKEDVLQFEYFRYLAIACELGKKTLKRSRSSLKKR